ncbi:hypothetical protein [Providencia manganoxydans]|uniref:hypothetical protein n=1 Tax=Providencia manganoxydans TaxID=2923283 RepID=UPI0034E51A88
MIELTLHGQTVILTESEAKEFIYSLSTQLNNPNKKGSTLTFSNQIINIKNSQIDELHLADC